MLNFHAQLLFDFLLGTAKMKKIKGSPFLSKLSGDPESLKPSALSAN
jgi:hypothetical protein